MSVAGAILRTVRRGNSKWRRNRGAWTFLTIRRPHCLTTASDLSKLLIDTHVSMGEPPTRIKIPDHTVRSIFGFLNGTSATLPENISISLVDTSKGHKLTPPSYEFEGTL